MAIRIVSSADRALSDAEIASLHDLMQEPEQREWDPAEGLDLEALTLFVREVLPDRPGQAIFLAKAGEAVAGMAMLFVHAEDRAAGRGTLGFGVRTAFQGRGIGRALVARALEHAAAAGLKTVAAEALPHNLRAIRLLHAAGFEAVPAAAPVHEPMTHVRLERRIGPGAPPSL